MQDNSTIELGAGEQLLWQGKPGTKFRFQALDIIAIPFGIFFFSFAVFWVGMAFYITGGIPVDNGGLPPYVATIFPLFGLPFVFIGGYIAFGRFIIDAQTRKKTHYYLTNKRVVIVAGLLSRKTKSVYWRSVSSVDFTEQPNGTGTIKFNENSSLASSFKIIFFPPFLFGSSATEFVMVPNAKAVNAIVTTQMQDRQ